MEKAAAKQERELVMTGEKLSNLAKRIGELPAGVPADALYDEMKRLSDTQSGKLKIQMRECRHRGEEQRLATEAEYSRLLGKLKDQLTDVTPEMKRRIIPAR